MFGSPACWTQSSTDDWSFTPPAACERCELSQRALLPVGLDLVCYVEVDPNGPTHCRINHRWGWERGNKKPSPRAKPSHYSTRQAWCLTWLPQLQPSQIPRCSHRDRFLSSSEWRAIRLYTHAPSTLSLLKKINKKCVTIQTDRSRLKCTRSH